jgi:hypothetical protein
MSRCMCSSSNRTVQCLMSTLVPPEGPLAGPEDAASAAPWLPLPPSCPEDSACSGCRAPPLGPASFAGLAATSAALLGSLVSRFLELSFAISSASRGSETAGLVLAGDTFEPAKLLGVGIPLSLLAACASTSAGPPSSGRLGSLPFACCVPFSAAEAVGQGRCWIHARWWVVYTACKRQLGTCTMGSTAASRRHAALSAGGYAQLLCRSRLLLRQMAGNLRMAVWCPPACH